MDKFLKELESILESFLGKSKSGLTKDGQLQFPCPRCIEERGENERRKHNLEVNLRLGVYQCWSCAAHDDGMHGSIKKLIQTYGTKQDLEHYRNVITELKTCSLYNLHYNENDFNIDFGQVAVNKDVELPPNFSKLTKKQYSKKALDYLFSRGIDWDLIEKFHIGYTKYDEKYKSISGRIIIPSFNDNGLLNYYIARDFTNIEGRLRYLNPKCDKQVIIFNEENINWDEDITIVEGVFDSIPVPNSIPLLGKLLTTESSLYKSLCTRANANINIMLDADAEEDAKKTYALLNHNRLRDKIRFIPMSGKDPSDIYKEWGKKGIIAHLRNAVKIKDIDLII